jgi:4-hydroxy-tetrahydrodipicolinate reductase
MGREILELIQNSQSLSPELGIDRSGGVLGFQVSRKKLDSKDFKNIDVLIEFSVADSFAPVLEFCLQNKIPLVSGTTGITAKDQKLLVKAGQKIPVLWSPNMSLGVATLVRALEAFKAIPHFDFQIEETHHRLKKDKPSGTGLLLQNKLQEVVGRKLPEVLAIRGGGVFGVHQVHALGDNETLIFEHRALNRKLFAEGALTAARWLSGQKAGLYSLSDLLKA